MDSLYLSLLVGALVTSQGAIWRPVPIQSANEPEQVFYSTLAGAVTNQYKTKSEALESCYVDAQGLPVFSLSCRSGKPASR